ncbi:MAG: hypothetical protein R3D51_10355 [Hyphomicrobiaceae bacterium]
MRIGKGRVPVLAPIVLIFGMISLTVAAIVYVVLPSLRPPRKVVLSADPDAPKPFGPAMAWIAVRTDDFEGVAETLELEVLVAANWDAGVGTIYDASLSDDHIFLSPSVNGWTFVAGVPLPLPAGRAFVDKLTPLLQQLGERFRDVQYFAAFPDVDFYAWARIERGRIVRAFAVGEEGVIWDRGRQSPQERALGLKLYEVRGIRERKGDAGAAIILHPTQEQVLRLACGWSLDPSMLDKINNVPAAIGAVARAPASWRSERIRKAA